MRLSVHLVFSLCAFSFFLPFFFLSKSSKRCGRSKCSYAPPFFWRHATRDTSGRMLNCSVPKIQEQHNNKTTTTPRRISCLVFRIWIQAVLVDQDLCCFLIVATNIYPAGPQKPSNPSFFERSTVFLLLAPLFCSPSVGRSKMPKCSETGMKKSELGSGSTKPYGI